MASCQKELSPPEECKTKALERYTYKGVLTKSNPTDVLVTVTMDYRYTLTNTQADFWLLNDLVVFKENNILYDGTNTKVGEQIKDTLILDYYLDSNRYKYKGTIVN